MRMQAQLPVIASALALAALLHPANADATPVTVVGGFTSFTGVTSGTASNCDPFLQASVAGTIVNAPSCTGPSGLWGPSSLTFSAPLQHVEFFELVNGSTINPNYVQFTPGPAQDVQRGDTFYLGSFSYRNGTWFGLSTETSFHITLTTVSTDSSLNGHVLSDDVVLYITPTVTGNTPEQNADFLYFSDFSNLGSVRAYEAFDSPTGTNVVNVALYGRIGSLIPTEWVLESGGFVDPGIAAAPTAPSAVPEPASLILLGSGLVGGGIRRWRRSTT